MVARIARVEAGERRLARRGAVQRQHRQRGEPVGHVVGALELGERGLERRRARRPPPAGRGRHCAAPAGRRFRRRACRGGRRRRRARPGAAPTAPAPAPPAARCAPRTPDPDRRRCRSRARCRPPRAWSAPARRRRGRARHRRARGRAQRPAPSADAGWRWSRRAATAASRWRIASVCADCQRLNGSLSWRTRNSRSSSVRLAVSLIGAEKPRMSEGTGRAGTSRNTNTWWRAVDLDHAVVPAAALRAPAAGRAPSGPTRPSLSGMIAGCLTGWPGVGGTICANSSR